MTVFCASVADDFSCREAGSMSVEASGYISQTVGLPILLFTQKQPLPRRPELPCI